jgi:hypothetical protein
MVTVGSGGMTVKLARASSEKNELLGFVQIVTDAQNEANLKPLLLETGGAMKVGETAFC